MRTKFHQNKRRLWRWWLVLFFSFLLILAVFNNSAREAIVKPLVKIAEPFLKAKQLICNWWEKNVILLNSKSELQNENLRLKERNTELETKFLASEALKKENEELKFLFSRINDKKYILASILLRPPQTPYDILIIDAGSKDGLRPGMMAVVNENILLGYAADVFEKTSKIKMISFPGEETNAMLQDANTSVIAIGRGGGNLEIKLPNSIEIKSGDKIMSVGTFPLLLGTVERVEINLSESFQKILFRLPVNLWQIKYVLIDKS